MDSRALSVERAGLWPPDRAWAHPVDERVPGSAPQSPEHRHRGRLRRAAHGGRLYRRRDRAGRVPDRPRADGTLLGLCPLLAADWAENPQLSPSHAMRAVSHIGPVLTGWEGTRMATFRTIASAAVASAVIFAGLPVLATPAHACDSNYPWTCKPVPSIDPPETAAEPDKAA